MPRKVNKREKQKFKFRKYNQLVQRLQSIESHHENAKLDMTFVQRDAERAKIAVEDNVARNQSKGKTPKTPPTTGKNPK